MHEQRSEPGRNCLGCQWPVGVNGAGARVTRLGHGAVATQYDEAAQHEGGQPIQPEGWEKQAHRAVLIRVPNEADSFPPLWWRCQRWRVDSGAGWAVARGQSLDTETSAKNAGFKKP